MHGFIRIITEKKKKKNRGRKMESVCSDLHVSSVQCLPHGGKAVN